MKKEFKRLKDGRWYWRAMFGYRAASNIHPTRAEARKAYKQGKKWVKHEV